MRILVQLRIKEVSKPDIFDQVRIADAEVLSAQVVDDSFPHDFVYHPEPGMTVEWLSDALYAPL